MYTDDRDDLESCRWEPKIHVITTRRLLCTFLLWLHFSSKKYNFYSPLKYANSTMSKLLKLMAKFLPFIDGSSKEPGRYFFFIWVKPYQCIPRIF